MAPPGSSSRALNAILPLVSTAPYEAHQKARTFGSRYVKSEQYDVAIDVLFASAKELLKAGQAGSGCDLAGFLLDVYDRKDERVNEESRGRLTQLIALTGSEGGWRKTIIDKSLAWSAAHGEYPGGDPGLHHYVGEMYFKEGLYEHAEPHLLASGKRDSARLLAETYIAWSSPSPSPNPFALRGTLPFLLAGNILAARTFIAHLTPAPSSSEPAIRIDDTTSFTPTPDPLLTFCQLAVATCQRAQGDRNKVMRECWVRLCGTYQSKGGLLAQPEVRRVLNELSTLYFAIPPPKGQAANPFGDVMSSLFGGGMGAAAPQEKKRVLAPPVAVGALD